MPQSQDFDAAKWINNQQLYPGFNVPKDILYERRCLLRIPPYYHGLVPRSSISIQELIDSTSIPSYDRTLRPDPSFYFSSMRPDLDLPSDLASRTIPSVETTSMLLDSFGQQWFDGAMSFQDPRQPSRYLPFWVLTWWYKLGLVVEARLAWSKARLWVLGRANEAHPSFHAIRDVLRSFETLGWNIIMEGAAGGMRSRDWVDFLSSDIVKGGFVDAMMETINLQIQQTNHLCGIVSVEDLSFSHALRYDTARWKKYKFDPGFSRLRRMGNVLCDGTQGRVLFPINIEDTHWTLFSVNGVNRQINYGDTLGWPRPFKDVERIQQWLGQHGQRPFAKAGDMPHGKQTDSYSCTIGMVNTARHDIFGDDLFTDTNKDILRLREYLRVVESHNDFMSVS